MSNEKPKTALAQLMDSVKKPDETDRDTGVVATVAQAPAAVAPTQTHSTQTEAVIMLQQIDPDMCQPWDYADRPEDEMGDIDSLTTSIKANGQQEPVLLRQTPTARGKIQYEVIFGNRRWRACKLAGVKMLSIVKPLSDQQAALYQKEENENRKDLSDLARARSYKAQLDAGIFRSERELSEKLGISRQSLNDILSFNRLPNELTESLSNLKNVSRKTVVKMSVMSKEKKKLKCLLTLTPKINTRLITSSNIEKEVAKMMGTAPKPDKTISTMVKDDQGRAMFSVMQSPKGETIIKINASMKEKIELEGLKTSIQEYLLK